MQANDEPDDTTASLYIRENFRPDDRIALVFLDRERLDDRSHVENRLVQVETVAAPRYQAWLRSMNARHYDVYIGMNPVTPMATARSKDNVAAIRHVYLDFDHGGRPAVDAVLASKELPRPTYVVNTSKDNFQLVWKARDFDIPRAERLMRSLSREVGADITVTDASRVMRLPGFNNWKREEPHFVTVERIDKAGIVRPGDFPERLFQNDRDFGVSIPGAGATASSSPATPSANSQSERDWAYAMRRLKRGDDPGTVAASIERFRTERGDKAYPHAYAERTVKQAMQRLSR